MDLSSADARTAAALHGDHGELIHPDEPERLVDLYEREYRVLPADRDALRKEVHRLRYKVYCLENPFEAASDFPDGYERDDLDDQSVHSLLQRRSDGASIGTVRLILPKREPHGRTLPFHQICRPIVPLLDLLLPTDTMAEISRFCISKELRRRAPGGRAGSQAGSAQLTRYATLGLIRSLVEGSVEHGITHWCMVVEPSLLRFLASLGLIFYPLGPTVEHHGLRQPCHADLTMLLDGVLDRRPDVWEVITEDGHLRPQRTRVGPHAGAGRRRASQSGVDIRQDELAAA